MNSPDKIVAATRFLQLVERGGWMFAQRPSGSRAVCIAALTAEGKLVLVEQLRPPLGKAVIELPAGLVGDLESAAQESLREAAERELAEETGYAAQHWQELATLASCPGLTDETATLFQASNLVRCGPGGGDGTEQIRVHEVPLPALDAWLQAQQAAGKMLDARVYAALYLIRPR